MRTAPATRESKAPPLDLLRSFLCLYPFQPATALWRWFEVEVLLRVPMPRGLVLDLGCGDGKLTQIVADRAQYLTEFDRRTANCYYWEDAMWSSQLRAASFQRIEIVPYFERSAVRRFEDLANATAGIFYKRFAGRTPPIEIQLKLGMRRGGQRMPGFAAAALARILVASMRVDPGVPPSYGCRLVRAVT